MTAITYPTCINKCYLPEDAKKGYETYDGKLLGKMQYYALNPCMLRLKFAQLAVTDVVVQPIMTIVMMVSEIYLAIKVLFNCIEDKTHPFAERASKSCPMLLHALSLPFVMLIPALLAVYSVIDVKNGRHAYCAVERYMYSMIAVGDSDVCYDILLWPSRKPFLTHMAKPFAPIEIVDQFGKHCKKPAKKIQ